MDESKCTRLVIPSLKKKIVFFFQVWYFISHDDDITNTCPKWGLSLQLFNQYPRLLQSNNHFM